MKKYGLLVYPYISAYQAVFDVITTPFDAVEVWPKSEPIRVEDKQGQIQYQWPDTVFFKIVEDSDWGIDQDNAVNQAMTAWNNDPDNINKLIPNDFQLIFEDSESQNIKQIFENERERLISLL